MNKTTAATLLTLALMATASADWCMGLDEAIDVLYESEELMILHGQKDAGLRNLNRLTVWANAETRTWTIIEQRSDDEFCVLGWGYDLDVPERLRK